MRPGFFRALSASATTMTPRRRNPPIDLESTGMREKFEKRGRLPTPEEIRRECAHIRQGWSAEERRQRAARGRVPWLAPIVPESCFEVERSKEEGE
jgi:hypothetical protein